MEDKIHELIEELEKDIEILDTELKEKHSKITKLQLIKMRLEEILIGE